MDITNDDGAAKLPMADPPKSALTPPTSEEWNHKNDPASSDLSDLDLDLEDDDIGDIEPDHYYDGGNIPVFKPTMDQFRSFKKFISKIDHYGMKAGIVKVIPPKEWTDALPALDEAVKTIKVKNPITQEFSGTFGTYTQANIEKQRSYNLPQWKALTEESQHQPPAKRGERRRQQEKTTRPPPKPRSQAPPEKSEGPTQKRRPGRPRKGQSKAAEPHDELDSEEQHVQTPPTPTSPNVLAPSAAKANAKTKTRGPKQTSGKSSKANQPKSVSERRKYNTQDAADEIDETAFKGFDYRFHGNDEFTPERCRELENSYWKGLTFAPPMYGADMPGSLFNDDCKSWNVAHLENLLDVLGQKVPGVNTAYLYLGMWKATFAWHLEDVDLYSINYIHFGAPKQWYSISQADARKFENAMRQVWPNDSKHCSQFLRHKTYLISPSYLKQYHGVEVNRLVHNEGEFVITFPYGYHSGYNLGYNCAESVNFATESWLEYGRIAKKCDCEADSVWIDVADIERKLRGEPTPEYYEETDEDDEDDEGAAGNLPSPPASVVGKSKGSSGKRKRGAGANAGPKKVKKIKIRIRTRTAEPCALCPNDMPMYPLLPTDTGRQAHAICGNYTDETTVKTDGPNGSIVRGVANVPKSRLDLKCSYCRSKKGACFQCSEQKCFRAYHATCAAAAGVRVDFGPEVVMHTEDGSEYYVDKFDFRCKYHRSKRAKNPNVESLESNRAIKSYVESLHPGDVLQMQHLHGDIFAGLLKEKRPDEQTVLVNVMPEGDDVEVEFKWILAPELEETKRIVPSSRAKPLPPELQQSLDDGHTGREFGPPRAGEHFIGSCTWAEFDAKAPPANSSQVKVDLDKSNQIWHYLGKGSTDARAQFTEDPSNPRNNPASNFLEIVRRASRPVQPPTYARNWPTQFPSGAKYNGMNGPTANARFANPTQTASYGTAPRPYEYKPKLPGPYTPAVGHVNSADSYSSIPNRGSPYGNPLNTNPSHAMSQSNGGTSASSAQMGFFPGQLQAKPNQWPLNPMVNPMVQTSTSQGGAPTLPGIKKAANSNAVQPVTAPADHEYLGHIKKYPYLLNAFLRRPKVYQSPYTREGGVSQKYASAALHPAGPASASLPYGTLPAAPMAPAASPLAAIGQDGRHDPPAQLVQQGSIETTSGPAPNTSFDQLMSETQSNPMKPDTVAPLSTFLPTEIPNTAPHAGVLPGAHPESSNLSFADILNPVASDEDAKAA